VAEGVGRGGTIVLGHAVEARGHTVTRYKGDHLTTLPTIGRFTGSSPIRRFRGVIVVN
jgi:hypothetical protein